jgi:TPR repeat protein
MLTLPLLTGVAFHTCCGNRICDGCSYTMAETEGKNMELCPFCKAPQARSDKDDVERLKKLMEKGNAYAFYQLGGFYRNGTCGLPRDRAKANELYLKAGELGCADAYYNLGCAHENGRGVEIDEEKARYYYELAAINGSIAARHNIGFMELQTGTGNHQRAMKHFIIAARAGDDESLDVVKGGYMNGFVIKEEYANTLRECQKSQDEMKSDARDKALAARNYYST